MNPNYEIVESESTNEVLVIRDVGPWDQHMTITNGAEQVVKELITQRLLLSTQRLLYYDSENHLDEILVRNGRFMGFKAYRRVEPITGLAEDQQSGDGS